MNMKNTIKIKGYLEPVKFMDYLCYLIENKYGVNNCFIEPSHKTLKLEIAFDEQEDEEDVNKMEEEKEEEDNETNDLIMQIKLYKYSDEYILRFIHKKGTRKNFLDEFKTISELVKEIIGLI